MDWPLCVPCQNTTQQNDREACEGKVEVWKKGFSSSGLFCCLCLCFIQRQTCRLAALKDFSRAIQVFWRSFFSANRTEQNTQQPLLICQQHKPHQENISQQKVMPLSEKIEINCNEMCLHSSSKNITEGFKSYHWQIPE